MPAQALLLDFNGTISNDEQLLYEVYAEIVAERGVALSREAYVANLAGQSDQEVFARLLGDAEVAWAVDERVRRYTERTSDGRTISGEARAAVALPPCASRSRSSRAPGGASSSRCFAPPGSTR